jgi:hypothetical protein
MTLAVVVMLHKKSASSPEGRQTGAEFEGGYCAADVGQFTEDVAAFIS